MNPYRRKDGAFSTNPHNVTETRSKGRAKLIDTVGESSTDVDKVSYRGEGTRGRSRRGTTRGESQQLEGGLSKRVLAAKTLAEEREKRYSMYQNLLDSKAENERDRMEKRARDRMLMSVKPRKQPPRHVAADIVYPCNSDSDDLDSENSDDSYRLSEAMKDQTYN